MGSFSIWHWLVVLVVVILLFGAKRIPDLARSIGSSIRLFRKEMDRPDDDMYPEVHNTSQNTSVKEASTFSLYPTAKDKPSATSVSSTPSTQSAEPVQTQHHGGIKA